VKLHGIQEKQVPALDDDFAKDVSEFDTLDEYKNDIRAQLQKRNDERAENEFEVKLVDAICAEAQVDIPDSMIERQLDYQMRDMEMRLSYQGISMEDYFKYTGTDAQQMRNMYREDAEKTVRRQLVLEAIRDQEQITANDEDINKELARYAEMFKKTVEEYRAGLKEDELEYFTDTAVVNKTLEFLKSNNTAVKPGAKKTAAKKTSKAKAADTADADNKEAAEPKEKKPAARRTKKTAEPAESAETAAKE
ncbi:MAG: trigger factor, partial [Firmicutes bacterium]|nr:trigger factor [Bacillota bacterium]